MYMKIIKVFIALIGVFLVSPVIKYQPGIREALHTQDSGIESVAESETEVQETSGSDAESATAKTDPAEEASTEADIPGRDEGVEEVVSEMEPVSEHTEDETSVEKSVDNILESESKDAAVTRETANASEPATISQEETDNTQAQAVYEYQDPETIPEPSTVHAHT